MLDKSVRAAGGRRPRGRVAVSGRTAGLLLAVVVAVLAVAGPACAASYTWNVDASGSWFDSGKWNP
ncbi:hypothetical protein LDC_1510, partial [sediment metagenome]